MSSLVISNLPDSQHPNNSFLRELTEKECTALIGGSYAAYRDSVKNPPSTEGNNTPAILEVIGREAERLGINEVDIKNLIENLL